jgi:hypothetical protein
MLQYGIIEFWFKHRACMGQEPVQIGKFIVTYFGLCKFGEKH